MTTTKVPVELSSTPGIVDGSNATAITIDSSENVGIGNSSPDSVLTAVNAASNAALRIGLNNTSFNFMDADNNIFRSGAGTELMRLTSTGLGIGTSSPDTIMEIVGADPILTIRDSSTSSSSGIATLRLAESGASDSLDQYFDIRANAGKLEIVDNWNEGGGTGTRVTLDDSGNLLVGKTSSSFSVAGIGLMANDQIFATATSDNSLALNRLSTDGDIAKFYKDGTAVGSIGTTNSLLTIGSGDAGLIFNSTSNAIYPWNISTNAGNDNAIDLGIASRRIKNIYVSSGIYLGGTGAANHLDDYEEGTWTPSLVGNTTQSGQAYSSQNGTYTKIGRQVTCRFALTLSAEGTFGNAYIMLSGFPFSMSSLPTTVHLGNLYFTNMGANFISIGLQGFEGTTKAYLWAKKSASQNREYVGLTELSDSTQLTGTFTYFV